MKKLYIYKNGDVIDDLKCVGYIPSKSGSGKLCRFIMECQKCGRRKSMIGACIHDHRGTTHKACGKGLKLKNPRFHQLWCAMRTRTTNPNYAHWKDYGGRGINSDEFEFFIDFYDTMFESYKEACKKFGEKNVSLERIDVDGNYCKENCTWIHMSDQKGNQRKTVYFKLIYPDGKIVYSRNPTKYAREHNLNPSTLSDLLTGRIKSYFNIKGSRITKEEYELYINKKCND